MATRVGYERRAILRQDSWNAQIEIIERRITLARSDEKGMYQQILSELLSKKSESNRRLAELLDAHGEDGDVWNEMRELYERACEEMQVSLKKAGNQIAR